MEDGMKSNAYRHIQWGYCVVLILCGNFSYAGQQQQVQTYPATEVTSNSATLHGGVWSDMSTKYFSGNGFSWGLNEDYGNSVPSVLQPPTRETINFSGQLTGLACATTYYYAFNAIYQRPGGQPFPGQGEGVSFKTLQCSVPPTNGFTGLFSPANWQSGSNAPVNLVDTSNAPTSVTLSNYPGWAVSGATFTFPSAPSNGTVSFSYSIANGTSVCPASYLVGTTWKVLPNNGPSITFSVTKGMALGFGLNGQNLPNNFGCKGNGPNVIALTISNFVFAPTK
jgi:hypothetical protein